MKPGMQWAARAAVASAVAALLSACGGGGSDTSTAVSVNSVRVMGDSLADSGTFGFKATVQGSAPTGPGSTPIWPERVATTYGQTLCPHYTSNGTSFGVNATCTNYAVAGGRINNFTAPASPVSITRQIQDAGTAGYNGSELVLIDGGGNDAADLIGAYLRVPRDGGAAYRTVLSTVLDAATVNAAFAAGATGLAQVGGRYMQALAGQFATTIKTHTLDKGAKRVAIVNMPGITLTPRFRAVLASVSAASGAPAAAQAEAVFDGWVQAFNTQLASSVTGDSRIVIADLYSSFKDQATNPAQYQLTNVTTAACPVTGVGSDGLPTYTFPTCTAAALSAATPPAGATGGSNWWQTYGFADGFHPTPYGHQLVGQLVSRALAQAGWL